MGDDDNNVGKKGIQIPHDHDVLCGRGGAAFKHVGNYTFRYLVQLNKPIYVTCKKSQKRTISKNIVTAIKNQKPPGRFLELDTKTNLWYEISDSRTIEKTSQALREGQANILKKMKNNEEEQEVPPVTSAPLKPAVEDFTVNVSPSSAILQQQAMSEHDSAHAISLNESDLVMQQQRQQAYTYPERVTSSFTQNITTNGIPVHSQATATSIADNTSYANGYHYQEQLPQQMLQQQQYEHQVYDNNYAEDTKASSKRSSMISMFSGIDSDEDFDLPTNLSEVWNDKYNDECELRFSDKIAVPDNSQVNIPIIDETTMLRARRLSSYLTRSTSSKTPNSIELLNTTAVRNDSNEQVQYPDLTTEEEENIIRACSLLAAPTDNSPYSILPLGQTGKRASNDFGIKGSAVSILSEFSSMSITSSGIPSAGGGDPNQSSLRFSQLSLMDTDDIDDFMDHYHTNKQQPQQVYPTDNPRLNYIYSVLNQSNQNYTDADNSCGSGDNSRNSICSNKRNGIVFPEFIQHDVAKLVEE